MHSILPPSSAHIWGKPDGCTGWVAMAQKYLEPAEQSEDSAAGTASHEVGARLISGVLFTKSTLQVNDTALNGVVITPEIIEGAELYASDVLSLIPRKHAASDITLGIEQRIECKQIHKASFGTPDMWFYNPETRELFIWDYKFGYLPVEAFENRQAINYAAGILEKLGLWGQDVKIRIRIVQPRAIHRDGPVREWAISSLDLQSYFNTLAVNAGIAMGPNAALCTGSHCRYCQARHACPPAIAAGVGLYEVSTAVVPIDLTPEALGLQLSIVTRAMDQLKGLESGYQEQVKALQKAGTNVPGWGLEPAYGNESWAIPIEEVFTLGKLFKQDLRQNKAITPNQARKKGIDATVINSCVERRKTGLKLVKDNGTKAKLIFGG